MRRPPSALDLYQSHVPMLPPPRTSKHKYVEPQLATPEPYSARPEFSSGRREPRGAQPSFLGTRKVHAFENT
jgi:hypothetical protein